jgi:hypothetical protein
MRKPVKVKVGDVWTAPKLRGRGGYRTVLRIEKIVDPDFVIDVERSESHARATVPDSPPLVSIVLYSTPRGHVMQCCLRTFRRWIYHHAAARAQRKRRRDLNLNPR